MTYLKIIKIRGRALVTDNPIKELQKSKNKLRQVHEVQDETEYHKISHKRVEESNN